MSNNSRFFIVGSGRSGSTLLRLLLMGHPRLFIPPETWFLLPLVKELPLSEPLTSAQVARAIKIIATDYRWPDMAIAETDLAHWAMDLQAPTLREVVDPIYNHLLNISGKPRLGDKTPPYIHIVPQIAALYPDAKFIHLIRDGRDVAISYIHMGYECRCYDGEQFDWTAAVRKGIAYRQSMTSAQLLEVRYEDLVSNTESTLRHICAFLEEDFETGMLHWKNNIPAIPARERHIHGKLEQPITVDAIAVWRRTLSALECFVMESCMSSDLLQLGYPLRFRQAAWRPLLSAAGTVFRKAAPVFNRVIPALGRRSFLPKRFYF